MAQVVSSGSCDRLGKDVRDKTMAQDGSIAHMRFVARQPIFDANINVFAYELLFRDGFEDFARIEDSDAASRMTADVALSVGLDVLCHGRPAFINCTRRTLLAGLIDLFPPELTVPELLETIDVDEQVLEFCAELHRQGRLIAVDDVAFVADREQLLACADFIKVDFRLASKKSRAELAKKYCDKRLVAEKVESIQDFQEARALGYHYFQGFFFQRPVVLGSREIPALKQTYFRLLEALQHAEVDFQAVENVIKSEPSLTYKLLRYLNSAVFAFRQPISSIRHALTMLGELELRRWLSVAALMGTGVDKPEEFVLWSLVRARFCELVGTRVGRSPGMFLMGLVSCLPVLLNLPLDFILSKLRVSPDVNTALLGGRNRHRQVIDLIQHYEHAEWQQCRSITTALHLSEAMVTQCYFEAVTWAHTVTNCSNESARC